MSSLDAEELGELRLTVRDASTEAGYPERVRELEGSPTGLDADLWKLLAEDIGLAGVGLPEEVGGLGGLAEVLAVAEELGATLAPVPFVSSTVLAGQILAGCGSAADPYLERVAAGEVAGPAITDTRGVWSADAVGCTSDGAAVSGSVRFVPFGTSAGFFVVAARTDAGIDVFAVEAADAEITPLASLDFSRPSATVTFDSAPAVRLTADGAGQVAVGDGVDVALLAVAADQLGGTQRCFDMTLDYVKVRRQFNREIGSFQAIKHRMADALMLVEMARSGLERITWAPADNRAAEASVIKAWGSDSYQDLAAEAIQLHGGIGFTWEHDAHLYFRRARYDAAFLGDAPYHRERVATLLGW
ncbi:MAG: acyl-CoA dehydrogenase [Actinomycetales bacterium]|nr:acyl-CoA dehydrogenase [Actinomycetales bacterium]